MKLMPFKGFNENYLSRETTTAIKGIFVFFVFLSHFSQYYPLGAVPGDGFYYIKHNSGQLVVTMFLFYSGYGIYENIKCKGSVYVKTFPKNRILKTLVHLDAAVLIYVVLDCILGIKFKATDLLLSFTGWSTIGNSNWFMFTIIVQYIIVFLSFIIFRKRRIPALITATALSVIYMYIMYRFKENYWYNTALCLPFGMWYSHIKDGTEKVIMKNNITYFSFLIAFAAGFYFSYRYSKYLVCYELWMLTFTVLILLISMKINVCNRALTWLGGHVFSIYILQRIPMIIFTKTGVEFPDIRLCFAACFAVTAVFAWIFDTATGAADKKLFKVKDKKIKVDLAVK